MLKIGGFLCGLLFLFSVQAVAEPVDFSLPDLQGKAHKLSDYEGKWVIINYWATWCPPCLDEIPELVDFHERRKDTDAVVLGINFEDIGREQLDRFVDEYFINYPILRNTSLTPPSDRLAVDGLPTTYIISPQGEPMARQVGAVTAEMLDAYIDNKMKAMATTSAVKTKSNEGAQ